MENQPKGVSKNQVKVARSTTFSEGLGQELFFFTTIDHSYGQTSLQPQTLSKLHSSPKKVGEVTADGEQHLGFAEEL